MEYLKSVIPVIESNYVNFTTVERSIADFFIYNREQMDFSAKSVAGKLFVSEASLSRFAKKCGFRGYREFIYQYEENFVVRQDSMTGNTRTVLNAYQELLNKTYNLVNEKQVERVCRYMAKAGRVFVCGTGSSGLAAREMELRFMRIGLDITSMEHSDMIRMRGVFQDENCLVFGVSISGEKEEVLYLLEEAHKRGARTVMLTARNRPDFDAFCDEVVLLPSLLHLNHGNVISPQFPILLLTDILYSYYLSQDQYKKEVLHDSTLRALEKGRRENNVL